MPPLDTMKETTASAKRLFSSGKYKEALEKFYFVVNTIEAAVSSSQNTLGWWMGGIGFAIGCLIPVAHIVTAPLGAYLGYKWSQGKALKELGDTPYWAVYSEASQMCMKCLDKIKGD